MTFTFKLSRRLARIRAIHAALAILAIASCAPGEPISSGLEPPPTDDPLFIQVVPDSVTLDTTATINFEADAHLANGTTVGGIPVTWTATGGTITANGRYTAGRVGGRWWVIGRHTTGKSDTSVVIVSPRPGPAPTLTAVQVTPTSAAVVPGGTQTFTAQGLMSDGSTSAVSVNWTATGGTIGGTGLYTAGSTAGTYQVIGTQQGGTLADTATVTVTSPPATLVAVVLTPASASLQYTQTQQFAAVGQLSDGSTTSLAVTWTANGGTVSSSGLYRAGSAAGNFRVIAASANGLADTSAITISAPTVTTLTVTPATASVQGGGTQQFTASATLSNGATQNNPSVTWSATGGAISSTGLFTAGATAGSFQVIGASANGVADTSAVTVTVAPTVTALSVTPTTASLQTGQTQQFSVSATLSNGSTQNNPIVTWIANGGTINGSGLYTAGSTAGSFLVVAASANGVTDTSTVTITAPPPPTILGITLTPASFSLQAGQAQQLGVVANLLGGATLNNPAVTWSATGGTISSGVYTAGGTTGTFRVIAVLVGGVLADTSVVTVTAAVPSSMYFNSSEAGCGTDPNVVFCDDFERGVWYGKDCDAANASGGLLQTSGWCGTIYANPIAPLGAASCGGMGANGTNCTANGGRHSGGQGGVNMGSHEFSGGPVTELYARWYYKTDPGYVFGAEKHTNFTKAAGDIAWFNIQFNCGGGGSSTATPSIQIIHGSDLCQSPNVSSISLQSGRWYYFEVHAKLNSSGTTPDGLIEMWINDCGTNGVCSGSPTLRTRMTNVAFDRNQTGCTTSPCKIEVLWFENWANPGSTGTGYVDQIKAAKVGPVGF
jgi:hypothetical protein